MQRFKSFLIEAVNYEEIFNSLWKAVPEIKSHELEYVQGEVRWARKKLKKQDRIVWYLQWIRLAMVSEWGSDKVKASEYAKIIKANPTLNLDDNNLKGEIHPFLKRIVPETHTELEHFFSMDIPAIEKYKFVNYVSYENTIFGQLKTFEDEYMDGHEASIPYARQPLEHHDPNGDSNSGISIIKQFPHDYYWVDLKKSSCRLEGDSMGHCGNTATNGPTETVLSFRKLNKRGKDEKTWLWEPHMTFILDKSNGFLGEMKGRNNKKPNEEYHKYIIALLKDPIIKGIRGGGYAPEQNFDLDDLTPEQRDKLFDAKPCLMGIKDYYKKMGKTDELIEKINAQWDAMGGDMKLIWDESQDHVAVAKFPSLDSFVEDYGNETANWCRKQLNGEDHDGFFSDYVYDGNIEEVLDSMNQTRVEQYLKENYPDEWEEDDGNSSLLDFIKEHDPDFYDAIESAARAGEERGGENDMYKDYIKALTGDIEVVPDDNYNDDIASAYFEKDHLYDEPVILYMTFRNIMAVVTDEDAKDVGVKYRVKVEQPYNGWSGWDIEGAKESLDGNSDYDFF